MDDIIIVVKQNVFIKLNELNFVSPAPLYTGMAYQSIANIIMFYGHYRFATTRWRPHFMFASTMSIGNAISTWLGFLNMAHVFSNKAILVTFVSFFFSIHVSNLLILSSVNLRTSSCPLLSATFNKMAKQLYPEESV